MIKKITWGGPSVDEARLVLVLSPAIDCDREGGVGEG